MTRRDFLCGNQAIARGAWEAGVRFATGYPGTPSTEILETIVGQEGVDAHWAANEKVAFEEAMGFAIACGRAWRTGWPVWRTSPRPPMFCVGCGHRTVFDVLGQLKVTVAGDIGCYTMGALPPYEAEHTTFCMGASIGTAVGLTRAGVKRCVAVIGDSTFIHSGIPSLIDAVYTETPVTVLILDNSTTGMTGQQSHPGSGQLLDGATAPAVDLEALVRATGVRHGVVVDTWDRSGIRKAVLTALAHPGPAVVIIRGPCQLLPEMRARDAQPLAVVDDLCTACNACYRIACPAITPGPNGLPVIDPIACVDCSVCQQLCRFDAIVPRVYAGHGETVL